MALPPLASIVNGTVADALPVDGNYTTIRSYINTDVISRDGSVQMTAPLLLQAGNPTAANHAASKAYVDSFLPVGIILPWPGLTAPTTQWLLCNGASVTKTAYPELFGVLDYHYGGSGGSFLLPNLKGRVIFGLDGSTDFTTVGETGGTFTVPIPAHAHPMPHTHTMAHTHEHPHTHTMTHDHPQFNTVADGGKHAHTVASSVRNSAASGSTSSFMRAASDGTTASIDTNPVLDGAGTGGGHVHQINVPSYTGSTGAVSEATTGQPSAASTGASSNANTSNAGTSGARMIPPYITLNYIIRAK